MRACVCVVREGGGGGGGGRRGDRSAFVCGDRDVSTRVSSQVVSTVIWELLQYMHVQRPVAGVYINQTLW